MHGITGLALVTTMQQLTMKRYTNVKREINISILEVSACIHVTVTVTVS